MCDILITPTLCPPQVYPDIVAVNSFKSFIYFSALIHQIIVLTTARLNNELPKYIVGQTIACLLGATGPLLVQNDLVAPTPVIKATRYIFGLAPITIAMLCAWYRMFRPTTTRSIIVAYVISFLTIIGLICSSIPLLWYESYLVPWASLNIVFTIVTTPTIVYVLVSYRHAKRWWYVLGLLLSSVAQLVSLTLVILNRTTVISNFNWWFFQIDMYHFVSIGIMSYVAQRRRNFSNTTDTLVT